MATLHPFDYQAPTPRQIQNITAVREQCKTLYDSLRELQDAGLNGSKLGMLANHQSIAYYDVALERLNEVSMWANKAIAFTTHTDE